MKRNKKVENHPQKFSWKTLSSHSTYESAVSAKMSAVTANVKIKRRPDDTFDLRIGTPVKHTKEEQDVQSNG